MPKMTDQEFENLFRQAANRISPGPQPGDWEDMQRRLEAAERDARARNISLYSMVALLLLYSFLMPDSLKFGRVDRASLMPVVEQQDAPSLTGESPLSVPEPANEKGNNVVDKTNNDVDKANTDTGKSDAAVSVDDRIATVANEQQKASTSGTQATAGLEQRAAKSRSDQSGVSPELNVRNDKGVAETSSVKTSSDKTSSDKVRPGKNTALTFSNESVSNGSTSSEVSQPLELSTAQSAQPVPGAKKTLGSDKEYNASSLTGESRTESGTTPAGLTSKDHQTDKGVVASASALATDGRGSQPTSIGATTTGATTTEKNFAQGNPRSTAAVMMSEAPEAPSTDPLLADPQQKPATVSLVPPGRVVVPAPANPWFVKFAISPDFSSIDYGSAGKTGVNFGPMVEYGISPRFSVSTGAIWSKKLYDEQNPEKTYGTGGYTVKANKLVGDCRILDIPINVTYYVMPGRKTNLFVTAGVSSYIMLKEEYVYTVERNSSSYEYTENFANKNNEWFSMLNLSLGIQQQIASRWYVQGEPFLKAPMKGIGEGKVNLVSAGVFVSVKYRINP